MKRNRFTDEMGYSVQLAECPDPFPDDGVRLMLRADLARGDRQWAFMQDWIFLSMR